MVKLPTLLVLVALVLGEPVKVSLLTRMEMYS